MSSWSKIPPEVRFILAPSMAFALTALGTMVFNVVAHDPDNRTQTLDMYEDEDRQAEAKKHAESYTRNRVRRLFDARVHHFNKMSVFNNDVSA